LLEFLSSERVSRILCAPLLVQPRSDIATVRFGRKQTFARCKTGIVMIGRGSWFQLLWARNGNKKRCAWRSLSYVKRTPHLTVP